MNVYDFDKTVYLGDSSIDFYLFCVKHNPSLLRFLPRQVWGTLCYALRQITKKQWKEAFFCFLQGIEMQTQAEAFWQKNSGRVCLWYLSQKREDDVIISASPEFLLRPICTSLGVKYLIASRVTANGHFYGENCRGEEKCKRFREEIPNGTIEMFYSDSLSDLPMALMAQQAFLVKKGICQNWKF